MQHILGNYNWCKAVELVVLELVSVVLELVLEVLVLELVVVVVEALVLELVLVVVHNNNPRMQYTRNMSPLLLE